MGIIAPERARRWHYNVEYFVVVSNQRRRRDLAIIGRYLLTPEVYLENQAPGAGGEIVDRCH